MIVEVLSRSTGDRDRGARWVGYRELLSLQDDVLIARDRRRVEVYTRTEGGWSLRLFEPPLVGVALPAIGDEVELEEIYAAGGC